MGLIDMVVYQITIFKRGSINHFTSKAVFHYIIKSVAGWSLFQATACRLFVAEPLMTYSGVDIQKHISVKFGSKYNILHLG